MCSAISMPGPSICRLRQMNLSKAEVYGVVTFYKDFRSEVPGTSVIHGMSRRRPARSMGAERLARHAPDTSQVDFGGTTSMAQ